MPPLPTEQADLWAQWSTAAEDRRVAEALSNVFALLADQIAARKPICRQSGRCCHFDSFGHRLYVTGLEIVWMMRQLDAEAMGRLRAADLSHLDGCPFQVNQLCTVHALRPLGCRVFFCDATATAWQSEIYEGFLADLRSLHDQFHLPYRYMEWRAGLDEARVHLPR